MNKQKTPGFAIWGVLALAWILLGCVIPRIADPLVSTPAAAPAARTPLPTLTPTPAFPPEVVILDHARYTDGQGDLHIVGEVYNNTKKKHQFVQILGEFYNSDRRLIAEEERYAYVDILLPGEKAPFELVVKEPPPDVQTYTLTLESSETGELPFRGIEIGQHHTLVVNEHTWFIVGEVINTSKSHANDIRLAATVYNADGGVLDVSLTYALPSLAAPGEKVPFKLYLDGLYGIVRDYTLIVNGEAAAQYVLDKKPDIGILSTHTYTDKRNNLVIVGEIHNADTSNAAPIAVSAAFYDAEGTLLTVESSYAWHDVVIAGDRSPFQIEVRNAPDGIDHWMLWIRGYKSDKTSAGKLALHEVNRTAHENALSLSGIVANEGKETMTRLRIAAVAYKEDETILAMKRCYLPDDLWPGESVPFECTLDAVPGDSPFRLYVQGSVKQE